MAHNLNSNENTGNHSFFSVKEKAWHGLGQIVDQYPTSGEAIAFAGLDYQVQKTNLLAMEYPIWPSLSTNWLAVNVIP